MGYEALTKQLMCDQRGYSMAMGLFSLELLLQGTEAMIKEETGEKFGPSELCQVFHK